jgi:hypothetical protein
MMQQEKEEEEELSCCSLEEILEDETVDSLPIYQDKDLCPMTAALVQDTWFDNSSLFGEPVRISSLHYKCCIKKLSVQVVSTLTVQIK